MGAKSLKAIIGIRGRSPGPLYYYAVHFGLSTTPFIALAGVDNVVLTSLPSTLKNVIVTTSAAVTDPVRTQPVVSTATATRTKSPSFAPGTAISACDAVCAGNVASNIEALNGITVNKPWNCRGPGARAKFTESVIAVILVAMIVSYILYIVGKKEGGG
jgi:hypothetical protein